MSQPVSVFWFRRDLRLHDNAGLYHALRSGNPVVPVFVFDTGILDDLEDKADRRLVFIRQALLDLQQQLEQRGSTLHVLYGRPVDCFRELTEQYRIAAVYTNHDYEPYAVARDREVGIFLSERDIAFHTYKDQCIFERDEIVKENGQPYSVFTPYSRKWREKLSDYHTRAYPTEKYAAHFFPHAPRRIPSLERLGFKSLDIDVPPPWPDEKLIAHYDRTRDRPGIEGTSRLSVHLRFGTISIRGLVREALALNNTFVNELIWRDFYMMILHHMPQVVSQSCKPEYDRIRWRNNEKEYDAWCRGETGYPLVDAGMRQLNATGWMHNRVRMVTASFLCKHLLIDWRWGEAYFAKKLIDYDLAANNGGWQWCAGSGCDAAPYFRIFNPSAQAQKFDPDAVYIRRWVPEFESLDYVRPIVEYSGARERCLKTYREALTL